MTALSIPAGRVHLQGDLTLLAQNAGLIVFAHGSGSDGLSPRNRFVATQLRRAGFGTLLFDLLTPAEQRNAELQFDIALLSVRLCQALTFIADELELLALPIGLFGAGPGAAAALRAARLLPHTVRAVVSRGGRPDLAGHETLATVTAPTLLVVGAQDRGVVQLNEAALEMLHCTREMVVVPHASHLFQEPGTLEEVARLAVDWYGRHLRPLKERAPEAVGVA